MSSAPYRLNIKRGRALPAASGAGDFLRTNDAMASLLPTIKRNLSLQADCQAILPAIFEACEILQLTEGQLNLAVPNAAVASKLKQQCPKLQEALLQRGWHINAIRIKVQVRKVVAKPKPTKQAVLTERALQAFASLENNLEDSSQNAELHAALQRLLKRNHRG